MDTIAVGVIVSSFGRDGWCRINTFSDSPAHFKYFRQIVLEIDGEKTVYGVEKVRIISKGVLIKLAGVNTCEQAKLLSGNRVWVERNFASPLKKGEYYSGDLYGCAVVFREKTVGKVVAVCPNPAHDLLEIELVDGKKCFVPFVDHFIGEIKLDKKSIELKEDCTLS